MPDAILRSFDDWLHTPVPYVCPDTRVELRRATPADFNTIYGIVDAAFGSPTPPAVRDWLYRRNPLGPARCLLAIDRSSGRSIACHVTWPWPVARGTTPLPAGLSGDLAVTPDWRRQGLYLVLSAFRIAHPWSRQTIMLSWPTPLTRRAQRRRGVGEALLGELPRRMLPLHVADDLARRGVPRWLAIGADRALAATLRGWQRVWPRGDVVAAVREVRRFDTAFDDLVQRANRWDGFWCPHSAAFLNWRYLDHPMHTYVALAAEHRGDLAGCLVVRVEQRRALLMEMLVPPEMPRVTATLLQHAIQLARDAGCTRFDALAAPRWPHWPVLRRAGFVRRPSKLFMYAGEAHEPDICHFDRWQISPGDVDNL
jgi:GNAT superfamily N-acetyltransferase